MNIRNRPKIFSAFLGLTDTFCCPHTTLRADQTLIGGMIMPLLGAATQLIGTHTLQGLANRWQPRTVFASCDTGLTARVVQGQVGRVALFSIRVGDVNLELLFGTGIPDPALNMPHGNEVEGHLILGAVQIRLISYDANSSIRLKVLAVDIDEAAVFSFQIAEGVRAGQEDVRKFWFRFKDQLS